MPKSSTSGMMALPNCAIHSPVKTHEQEHMAPTDKSTEPINSTKVTPVATTNSGAESVKIFFILRGPKKLGLSKVNSSIIKTMDIVLKRFITVLFFIKLIERSLFPLHHKPDDIDLFRFVVCAGVEFLCYDAVFHNQ